LLPKSFASAVRGGLHPKIEEYDFVNQLKISSACWKKPNLTSSFTWLPWQVELEQTAPARLSFTTSI
jgi:hypothetical protein